MKKSFVNRDYKYRDCRAVCFSDPMCFTIC
jgi:hypothetical protein